MNGEAQNAPSSGFSGNMQYNPMMHPHPAPAVQPQLMNDETAYEEYGHMEEGRRKRCVRKWSPEEDHLMVHLVREHGTRQWGLIGSLLNGRTGKQCRER